MKKAELKKTLENLYTGRSRRASLFRFTLIAIDLLIVVFFVLTTPLRANAAIFAADVLIAFLLIADLGARFWIAPNKPKFLRQFDTIADLIVILSLLLVVFVQNLAFLRVVRALRLLRSYHVLNDLRRESKFFRLNEDVIISSINLLVFIFVVTAVVFVVQFGDNQSIANYVDALYFTVTTLTTTGFGDIILTGTIGRLLSVLIMVVGVALFLRLVQTIFLPRKIRHKCPECGLNRHDKDAVHCKHCGHILNIETSGQL